MRPNNNKKASRIHIGSLRIGITTVEELGELTFHFRMPIDNSSMDKWDFLAQLTSLKVLRQWLVSLTEEFSSDYTEIRIDESVGEEFSLTFKSLL